MAITFKREFIVSQLGRALSSKKEKVSEVAEREIESKMHYRDQAVTLRANYIGRLSEVDFGGKPDDVRNALAAVHYQYGRAAAVLMDVLPTDEAIRTAVITTYGENSQRSDNQRTRYTAAADILKASNTENLSFADLKSLGIVGIESYGATAITSGPEGADKDGITPHTEEG